MFDWLLWFTHMENSKPLALVLFFGAFCGVLIYVFTGKQRAKRLESYKYIPFDDEESRQPEPHDFARGDPRARIETQSRKVMDNER
ncbi:MAG: cbb3-type cytochrome c oxidase subunit 3 [Candidatus Contendobacter sp.]|nr:cbb3-type cytochrome c oxidase subunit 3 [Candidatus Contendobacter sp.]MDG4557034.1 cbb3-type cytochrome c oxidase subunit 3 [Candidatus Contendobacter sp.]